MFSVKTNSFKILILVIFAIFIEKNHSANICAIYCFNNGECEFLNNDLICHCNAGFKGDCSVALQSGDDICMTNPCWNGGVCKSINSNSDFQCTCPSGTLGKNCKVNTLQPCANYDPCYYYNPCQNNARCETATINGKPNAVCTCNGPYTGPLCETFLPCTDSFPCQNNGTCYKNKCFCPPNFKGVTCETATDVNAPKIVKVKNLGWYTAAMMLTYLTFDLNGVPTPGIQTAEVLGWGNDYTFYVPNNANYFKGTGAHLVIRAVAGSLVMDYTIDNDPLCFHIWGGSLTPSWSVMGCW